MFITIQGRRIWYTEEGAGFPVILLHGYLESSEVWNGFMEKLAREFRVIAIDLPGHGRSDVYSETHSMEMMAAVVRDLADRLKVEESFMIGHSLGGYVTLAFLELFPQYLKGYCLFHSHPLEDSEEAIGKREREITVVLAGKKDLMYPDNIEKMFSPSNLVSMKEEVKRSKIIASGIPGNGIISMLKGMMIRPSRLKIMEEGKIPCLWVLGARDNYIRPDIIQKKVSLPPNAKILLLKNSGHMGFVEEEELSVSEVTKFIEETTGISSA